jgi:hypothetical protein
MLRRQYVRVGDEGDVIEDASAGHTLALRRRRSIRLGVAVVVVVAIASVGLLLHRAYAFPAVDRAKARAMAPAIEAYLDANDDLGLSGAEALHPRTVCTDRILYIATKDQRVRVGMVIACVDYARIGSKLRQGSGFFGIPTVLTLSEVAGHYEVLTMEQDQYEDNADHQWISQRFPWAVARALMGADAPSPPDPAVRARTLFGLPATAPIDHDLSGPAF